MSINPLPFNTVLGAFLLAFPALFSIVNPIGSALVFGNVTARRSVLEKQRLAGRIGVYSLIVLLFSLWLGGYVLNFFGISLGALRIGGGLVVAIQAWSLLMRPEVRDDRKAEQSSTAREGEAEDIAFFPLTMPFTTGPGSISAAIALASERPANGGGTLAFFIGISLGAVAVSLCVWLFYRSTDRVLALLGQGGARILGRLAAFLLLCIGVQILVNGVESLLGPLLRGALHPGLSA
jgi:multiple antibiotic resistance protein